MERIVDSRANSEESEEKTRIIVTEASDSSNSKAASEEMENRAKSGTEGSVVFGHSSKQYRTMKIRSFTAIMTQAGAPLANLKSKLPTTSDGA